MKSWLNGNQCLMQILFSNKILKPSNFKMWWWLRKWCNVQLLICNSYSVDDCDAKVSWFVLMREKQELQNLLTVNVWADAWSDALHCFLLFKQDKIMYWFSLLTIYRTSFATQMICVSISVTLLPAHLHVCQAVILHRMHTEGALSHYSYFCCEQNDRIFS